MKRFIQIFIITLIFVSCASTRNVPNKTSPAENHVLSNISEEIAVPSDIFDVLQRPLGLNISPQLRPVSRKNWEYEMTGIGWWDIYVNLGKKLGNRMFEKTTQTKGDYNLVELHGANAENTVNMVVLVFSSFDKNILERLRIDFFAKANDFFGKQGKQRNDGRINWEAGLLYYTSYAIQKHEDGNWIYLITSLDSVVPI